MATARPTPVPAPVTNAIFADALIGCPSPDFIFERTPYHKGVRASQAGQKTLHPAGRKFWIGKLSVALGADHRQALGIDEPDLHQNGGLIPKDVLMGNLAVLEADDDRDRYFNRHSGGVNSRQHPIDRRGM